MRLIALVLLASSLACGGRDIVERATTSTGTSTASASSHTSTLFTTATTTFSTATSCTGPCACGERPCPWPACATPSDVDEYGVETDASFVCVAWGATCAPVGCAPALDGSDDDASLDATVDDGACPFGVAKFLDVCTPMR
jgi:hypothetical protein